MEDIDNNNTDNGTNNNTDNGTNNNTDNGTNNNTDNTTPETKELPVGEDTNKSLDDGGESGKEVEEGEDTNKNLPTREHETKKINDNSGHENKANDKAYEEPEEVKVDSFNLEYFDKPEEAKPEVVNKANDSINGDLNYFDSWIAEAEDKKKANKEQLDAYLKSNVETGNQLAYTEEDAANSRQAVNDTGNLLIETLRENNILDFSPEGSGGSRTILNPIEYFTGNNAFRDIENNTYGNSTSKEEILQKIREQHPYLSNNISDNILNKWADLAVSYNKNKQIHEDLGRNGPTVNSGITKAEELDLMNRAASDYSSLSNAEKEMAGKVVEYAAAHPNALNIPLNPLEPANSRNNRAITERNQRLSNAITAAHPNALNIPLNPLEPANSRNNRAITERNQRLSNAITAVNTAREAERREAETTETETPTETTPTTETPVRTETPSTTSPTETETEDTTTSPTETETEDTTTSPTETETEEETTTETTIETPTDDEIVAKADEAKAAYEEAKRKEYEAIRGEADETTIAQLAAEADRLRQEWEEAEAEAAALRPREDGEENPETQTVRHGREDRELNKEDTLPEWVGGDDPHNSSAGAYWAGAFRDDNWSDKVPQKTAQGLINYANDHHDNPVAMFGMTALMDSGGYDALKAGKDVMDMIEAAKGVASDTSKAIDFFKNGSVLDGIKSILSAGWNVFKVLGNVASAAWHACSSVFSFIRSVFAPVSSAISSLLNTVNGYNSVKAMIRDMYGIENTDEVINEIFGDNSETNTEQTPVHVMNKTGFSVKGGAVTDESGYNQGLKEKENNVVSDACKKIMLYFPYLRKGIL